jgi:hypothetical protein
MAVGLANSLLPELSSCQELKQQSAALKAKGENCPFAGSSGINRIIAAVR